MEIKVLGPGCANCQRLARLTEEAVNELGLEATFTKVTGIQEIMSYGVIGMPALVVEGKVKVAGRVPSKEEIKKLLQGGSAAGRCGCGGNCCG